MDPQVVPNVSVAEQDIYAHIDDAAIDTSVPSSRNVPYNTIEDADIPSEYYATIADGKAEISSHDPPERSDEFIKLSEQIKHENPYVIGGKRVSRIRRGETDQTVPKCVESSFGQSEHTSEEMKMPCKANRAERVNEVIPTAVEQVNPSQDIHESTEKDFLAEDGTFVKERIVVAVSDGGKTDNDQTNPKVLKEILNYREDLCEQKENDFFDAESTNVTGRVPVNNCKITKHFVKELPLSEENNVGEKALLGESSTYVVGCVPRSNCITVPRVTNPEFCLHEKSDTGCAFLDEDSTYVVGRAPVNSCELIPRVERLTSSSEENTERGNVCSDEESIYVVGGVPENAFGTTPRVAEPVPSLEVDTECDGEMRLLKKKT